MSVSVRQRMSDDNKRFTVNDRRLFTRDGEKREAEDALPPPTGESRPPAAEARPPAGGDREESDPRGLDFVGLLISLGAQASALLVGDPGTAGGGRPPDLVGARAFIALLEVLKEKTEGRRTAEEDEVLESLLYELRMGYVALSRAGGA